MGADVGAMIREWRKERRMSQLALAMEAEVSTRHVSYVETGKSQPSRQMVLLLASALEVPLRERNAMLVAAGFAPVYRETDLADPAMAPARAVLELILRQHEPFPAVVVDRKGDLLMVNEAGAFLTNAACRDHAAMAAVGPPNVLRWLLHPSGVRDTLVDWEVVARAIVGRAVRELRAEHDRGLARVLDEVLSYPGVPGDLGEPRLDAPPLLVPTRFALPEGELAFVSTITTLGTAVDVTLQELRIESFFAIDETTERAMRARASSDVAG